MFTSLDRIEEFRVFRYCPGVRYGNADAAVVFNRDPNPRRRSHRLTDRVYQAMPIPNNFHSYTYNAEQEAEYNTRYEQIFPIHPSPPQPASSAITGTADGIVPWW